MPYSARPRSAAAGVAALLLALSPLLAPRATLLRAQQQQQQPPLPADTTATRTVASSAAPAPTNTSSLMTQEIYVAAFRASARRWCASAGPRAGNEPLNSVVESTHLITHGGVAEAERAGVDQAVDSAYAQLVHDGGCAALTRPATVVVVNRFDGHAWNAPKSEIAPDARGDSRETGLMVVTRDVKLGHRRFHKIGAQADYTFTSQRQQLVRGRYRVPVSAGDFAERWRELEALVGGDYPTLRVARLQPAPPAAGAAPTYAARSGYAAWRTTFSNPDTQALEVRMFAVPANGRAGRDEAYTIVVDYVGYADR
jgi:hypothetical protein